MNSLKTHTVGGGNDAGDGPWTAKQKVRHVLVCFKIYTGVDITVIPENLYLPLGRPKLKNTSKTLFDTGSIKLNVLGSFTDAIASQHIFAVEELVVVWGRHAISNLKLVTLNIHEVVSVKQKYSKLFRELGQLNGEYRNCI